MEDWIKAGRIAFEALEYSGGFVIPGNKILELVEKTEEKIRQLGGKPAFPINVSINKIAAHYTAFPNDNTEFKEGDLVKVDIGVHVNGCIGDTAITIDLGDNNELLEACRKALNEAVKIAKPGTKLFEIGRVIQNKIQEYGFSPIKNLSGHLLKEYDLHAGINIPNYDNNDKTELEEGQVIAIEPFATNGEGKVIEGAQSSIYRLEKIRNVRSQNARKLAEYINKEFPKLPFAKRWIKLPLANFSLNELEKEGIIYQYPQLVEARRGLVSQFEHTIIVGKKITTQR